MTRPQLITSQKQWDQVAESLASCPELAVDTEANSMYAYRGRICLVQLASSDSVYLLDPLAVSDLSGLGALLNDASITKVMHGSDYDLRSFFREYGFEIHALFDTETCARFLGMVSPNLAAVLKTFLDIDIPKSRRMQRSNWGLRPLSDESVVYAASDVAHLIPLARELRGLLQRSGRLDWVREEFARLEEAGRTLPEPTGPAYLRVKGSDKLDPRKLAVLSELHHLREAEAERVDLPPYRVMGNDALLYLAQNPLSPLDEVPGLAPQLVRRLGSRMKAAIQTAIRGPGLERPPRPRRPHPPSREVQARLQELKGWRTEKGATLGLDPALVWPAPSLERMAHAPESWATEIGAAGTNEIREWQCREFADELGEILVKSS